MVNCRATERVEVQQIELLEMISPAHDGLERRSPQGGEHFPREIPSRSALLLAATAKLPSSGHRL
jgi:hypothetical protein